MLNARSNAAMGQQAVQTGRRLPNKLPSLLLEIRWKGYPALATGTVPEITKEGQSTRDGCSDGKMPRDVQSAGLSLLTTWFHLSGGILSTISETRFPT